jgi:hypothetical protein
MPRLCIVCEHPDKEAMNERLAGGDAPGTLTLRWPEVSSGSFRRHRDNGHIKFDPNTVVLKTKSDELLASGLTNDAIVVELVLAYEIAKHMMETAIDRTGGETLALRAMREATTTLAMIHKLTRDETASMQDESAEELGILARALSRVLPRHPEAREDLIVELEASGQYALADALRSSPGRASSGAETLEIF